MAFSCKGFVSIRNRSLNDTYRDSPVNGQFFSVLSPNSDADYVTYIVESDGIDECSLGIFTGVGIATTDETIKWLNAGDVSISMKRRNRSATSAMIFLKTSLDF